MDDINGIIFYKGSNDWYKAYTHFKEKESPYVHFEVQFYVELFMYSLTTKYKHTFGCISMKTNDILSKLND